ncbi:Plant intracellular Ras-group-related LRR protein 1 [Hibiscus syriacus]|uniref:Plant intracellular Ras-group-related LRR protein 1 n=1 Tax=Hibiscus syriacus TaxID=106335 RepID=A0A6A2XHK9_HIBSY|nr:plant intracellular Ras-group-related LRR protein 6-like [Hibiscus syriacus]KAE8674998.1 Plant intracellular Ras-group-related LRR protein 1 [Hibiscus syriacus]
MMYDQQQPQVTLMEMNRNGGGDEHHRSSPRRSSNTDPEEKVRLGIVDLSGMSLDSLPIPSLNLATVSKLDLSNNNLQSIPESLTARLLNVVNLDVHSNQLKSLPNSIGCLSKLKILNVSGNFLQALPKTIENCRSLEELNANFNQLTTLPDTIGFELIKLKKLSVNSNKLIFLPDSTSHLTSLRVLDARLNCLRSLPDDMENLINLEVLNVSQNFQYLETLPYSIGLLISLVELDVSYNKIKHLPDSIGCLRKLQKLSVEGNPLVSPPMEVFEQSLQVVKEYLCEKMKEAGENPRKKKSWVGKLVKYATFNGKMSGGRRSGYWEREGFIMSEYKSIDSLASPRYLGMALSPGPRFYTLNMGMLSPRRLFSPRTYCTR